MKEIISRLREFATLHSGHGGVFPLIRVDEPSKADMDRYLANGVSSLAPPGACPPYGSLGSQIGYTCECEAQLLLWPDCITINEPGFNQDTLCEMNRYALAVTN